MSLVKIERQLDGDYVAHMVFLNEIWFIYNMYGKNFYALATIDDIKTSIHCMKYQSNLKNLDS